MWLTSFKLTLNIEGVEVFEHIVTCNIEISLHNFLSYKVVVSIIFYFHPETWGRFPFWRAYFSKGLKPPTSLGLAHVWLWTVFFGPSWLEDKPDTWPGYFFSSNLYIYPKRRQSRPVIWIQLNPSLTFRTLTSRREELVTFDTWRTCDSLPMNFSGAQERALWGTIFHKIKDHSCFF